MQIHRPLLSLTAFICFWSLFGKSTQTSQCEVIRIPMCMSMQWNLTQMPNLMDQSSQQNAQLKVEEYQPLVRDNCSEYLQFFLCAIFAPICTTNFHDNPIPPCREVCRQVKQGCEPVITSKYNKTWPENINCDSFPEYNNGVCISPQAIQLESIDNPVSTDAGENDGAAEGDNNVDTGIVDEAQSRSCNCRKKTRLHMRRYIQSKFGYVIRATVEGTRLIRNDLIMSLNIKTILKNKSDLRLRANETLILWTEGDSCQSTCPVVRKRKEYIIACNKNANANGRLMFDTDTCMISRWKNKWSQTIQAWERLVRMSQVSRNEELRRLRHVKKFPKIERSESDVSPQSAG